MTAEIAHKDCSRCGKSLPITLFGKDRKAKNRELRKLYGISLDDYNRLVKAQDGVCKICRKGCQVKGTLSVDHNHDTGEIRGLLCNFCNTGLGKFKDSPALLERAVSYLKGGV
jgi:hypothetical protein